MTEHPRLRNLAVALVLVLIYVIPAQFFTGKQMMDIASIPMLIWGVFALALIAREAVVAWWQGRADRTAYALFGLSLLFLSVDVMRSYGLSTRNIEYAPIGIRVVVEPFINWMASDDSHVYAVAIYAQFIGIWFFTRASFQPTVKSRTYGFGQLIAGVVIGAVLASSKVLEPVLMFIGRLFSRIF